MLTLSGQPLLLKELDSQQADIMTNIFASCQCAVAVFNFDLAICFERLKNYDIKSALLFCIDGLILNTLKLNLNYKNADCIFTANSGCCFCCLQTFHFIQLTSSTTACSDKYRINAVYDKLKKHGLTSNYVMAK